MLKLVEVVVERCSRIVRRQDFELRDQSAIDSQNHHRTSQNRPRPRSVTSAVIMSYYFAIIGTQDNPLFEYEFGTAKQGGDGVARFPEQARHMNQFIVHSSLDIVEEVQWGNGQMYVLHERIEFQALEDSC